MNQKFVSYKSYYLSLIPKNTISNILVERYIFLGKFIEHRGKYSNNVLEEDARAIFENASISKQDYCNIIEIDTNDVYNLFEKKVENKCATV